MDCAGDSDGFEFVVLCGTRSVQWASLIAKFVNHRPWPIFATTPTSRLVFHKEYWSTELDYEKGEG